VKLLEMDTDNEKQCGTEAEEPLHGISCFAIALGNGRHTNHDSFIHSVNISSECQADLGLS
jgi:hypothetical protein